MSSCSVDSKIYLFGGSGLSAVIYNDLHQYDTSIFILKESNIKMDLNIYLEWS